MVKDQNIKSKKSGWKVSLIAFFALCSVLIIYIFFQSTKVVNIREELPIRITEENIEWGKIRAFHPHLFYKKYRIAFATKNNIFQKDNNIGSYNEVMEYYCYVKNEKPISEAEYTILRDDSAQTFIKYYAANGHHYLLTVSGDHGGSANYRQLHVKLYDNENNNYKNVYNRKEIYSVDPGIDSYYFTEKIIVLINNIFYRDKRY